MVVKEFLDSDRVNFLVWRYLLEGNYRETAAKLQKEWHIKEPHRDFPFACHVKGHALINVINRGLLYNGLEREHARHQLQLNGEAVVGEEPESLQVGIFGPLQSQSEAKIEEEHNTTQEAPEESRKRSPNHLTNGSPTKKPRIGNGVDAAPTSMPIAEPADDAMAIDVEPSQTTKHAYPSPSEADQAPTPIVQTFGADGATQVDKVEELFPSTTFIKLVDDDAATVASEATATPTSSPAAPRAGESALVLKCEWNPKDPSVLAAAGTDALARIWTVSRASAAEPNQDHVPPQSHALLDASTPKSTTVTAMTWTSDGQQIAIATEAGASSVLSVWRLEGSLVYETEVPVWPIIKLAWNPSDTALLAVSPGTPGALITVYHIESQSQYSHSIPDYFMQDFPLDGTWTSDNDVLVAGGDLMMSLHCSQEGLVPTRQFETEREDDFRQVLFDRHTKLAATGSESGYLDIWDDSGTRTHIKCHEEATPITTMAWQPLPSPDANVEDERLLATGGEDGYIFVWNVKHTDSQPSKARMDGPVVRLAFTPDGAFLAAATAFNVWIWKVGVFTSPRAVWTRPPAPAWNSPAMDTKEFMDPEDEYCLCWDASGQKLAYSGSSKLAVINFSR